MNITDHLPLIDIRHNEQGASLIMALVVLLILTLFGTTGVREAVTDLGTTQLFTDSDSAFQSAESGLRIAETALRNTTSSGEVTSVLTTNNITLITSGTANYKSSAFWSGIQTYSPQNNVKIVVEPSHSVADSLDMSNPGGTTTYYKITANGSMRSTNGAVVVQSIFAKRFSQ